MSLTQLQENQIRIVGDKMNLLNEKMNRGFSNVTERVGELRKQEFMLEAFMDNTQVLEHYLKLTIQGYASHREILIIFNECNIYQGIDMGAEGKTLGGLIGIIKKLGISLDLAEKLEEFNTYRKLAVHNILDGDKDIDDFEDKIDTYMMSGRFASIFKEIYALQESVRQKVNGIVNEYRSK